MPSKDLATKPARRRRIGLLLVFLIGLAAIFASFRKKSVRHQAGQAARSQISVPVIAGTAREGDIGVYVQALGTVTPVYTVSVVARVQGEVTNVFYKEGQTVKKGDPLIEIDPRPYQAAVLQAEGALERDEGLLREARIDLARYRKAYVSRAIPKQQLDDQEQVVIQDEGVVKADQGTLASARLNVEYCHIHSPIDGRVGLRLVDPGNMIQANSTTALVAIAQIQPITVIFSVAEDYLAAIQEQLKKRGPGEKMQVEALDRAQSRKLATGTFETLDNLIDTTTGTVRIRAVFDNADGTLFPNQFVNVRLLVSTLHNATLVSTPAIQHGAQGPYVYVIKTDKTAEMRTIKIGTTDGDITSVDGVRPGEVIAEAGFDKLQEGSKVVLREGAEVAGSSQGTPSSSEKTRQEAGVAPPEKKRNPAP